VDKLKTEDNLRKSLSARATASIKDYAYSIAADKEGYHQIAKLYRALSGAERVHAMNHIRALGELGETAENLSSMLDSKTYDFSQVYPTYIEQADADSNPGAATLFKGSLQTSRKHMTLLNEAFENMIRFRENDYWVCQNCGYIEVGDMPLSCRICGGSREKFVKID
jgi:rubrerythrin